MSFGFLKGLNVILSCVAAASMALESLSALPSLLFFFATFANCPRMPAGAVPFLSRGTFSGERTRSRMVCCGVVMVAMEITGAA